MEIDDKHVLCVSVALSWLVEEPVIADGPVLNLLVDNFLVDFMLCIVPYLQEILAFVVSADSRLNNL